MKKSILLSIAIIIIAVVVSSFKSNEAPIINNDYVATITTLSGEDATIHFLLWERDGAYTKKCTDLATGEVLIENNVELIHVEYYFKCQCRACGHEWETVESTDIKLCIRCPQCDEKIDWDYCIYSCGDGYCTRERKIN